MKDKTIYFMNAVDNLVKLHGDVVNTTIQPKFIKVYKKNLMGNLKLKLDPRKIVKFESTNTH